MSASLAATTRNLREKGTRGRLNSIKISVKSFFTAEKCSDIALCISIFLFQFYIHSRSVAGSGIFKEGCLTLRKGL